MSVLRCFVTATDTDVGKTFVCAGLTRALRAHGRDAVAIKPIASGMVDGVNVDIAELAAAADHALGSRDLNVYCFEPPLAPHRAAELAAVSIDLSRLLDAYGRVASQHTDVLVEGVGGVAVPLGPEFMLSDLMRTLDLPVLLVVGMRLGCINHALLSAAALRSAGLQLGGWIANHRDFSMLDAAASVAAIAARIGAPLLGELTPNAGTQAFDTLAAQMLAGFPLARP